MPGKRVFNAGKEKSGRRGNAKEKFSDSWGNGYPNVNGTGEKPRTAVSSESQPRGWPWWPQLELPSETEPERLRDAAGAGPESTAEGPAPLRVTWASGRLGRLDKGRGQKQTCERAAPVPPLTPRYCLFPSRLA